jgi:hypothetical protein
MQVLFLFVFEENLKNLYSPVPRALSFLLKRKYEIYSSFWGLYYETFYSGNLWIFVIR